MVAAKVNPTLSNLENISSPTTDPLQASQERLEPAWSGIVYKSSSSRIADALKPECAFSTSRLCPREIDAGRDCRASGELCNVGGSCRSGARRGEVVLQSRAGIDIHSQAATKATTDSSNRYK